MSPCRCFLAHSSKRVRGMQLFVLDISITLGSGMLQSHCWHTTMCYLLFETTELHPLVSWIWISSGECNCIVILLADDMMMWRDCVLERDSSVIHWQRVSVTDGGILPSLCAGSNQCANHCHCVIAKYTSVVVRFCLLVFSVSVCVCWVEHCKWHLKLCNLAHLTNLWFGLILNQSNSLFWLRGAFIWIQYECFHYFGLLFVL